MPSSMTDVNRNGKPRQRAAHKKSRTGCLGCKRRRARCGEEQPACLNCLVYGTDCVYVPDFSQAKIVKAAEAAVEVLKPQLVTLLPASPCDPFDVLPVKMRYKSSEAFYFFIQDRTLLAHFASKDSRAFNSNLGLGMTDATWFQMTLCLTSAYRSLHREPHWQETYLHHRQGLLQWLKENLEMMHTVPCAYLSIIGSMIMSDGAFGDEASAWAHMQGAFALLEARKKPGVEWRFYDALHKRILMIAMSLFYISHHGDENEDEFGSYELDIGIIDMYTQLSNEYLRAPLLTGSPHAASRKDGPILSWLDKSLQQFRSDKPSKQSTAASGKSSKLDEKEKRMWTKAVSAYAMTVGSMDWFGMDQDGAASLTIASVELNRFRTWCGDMVEEWLATRKLMTRDIALQIWKKMEWFQSDEGLRVVREIALMARRDGVHQRMRVVPDEEKEREREGSEQDDAAVALEIMYI